MSSLVTLPKAQPEAAHPGLTVPDALPFGLQESFPALLDLQRYPTVEVAGRSVAGMSRDPFGFVLEVGPGVVQVRRQTMRPEAEWSTVPPAVDQAERQGEFPLGLEHEEEIHGTKGFVYEWSRQSRRNMIRTFGFLDWRAFLARGVPEMVTLTYPEVFPRDGEIVKRHLQAFKERWTRKWGAAPVGVWKLEFQRRGAPHFHLYVARPAVRESEFRRWVSEAWYEVVGSGDVRHLRAGTGVDRQFCARSASVAQLAAYFAKHNAKWGEGKGYQNDVPEGFEHVGRFWGAWGMAEDKETVRLARGDFHAACRIVRRLQRAARARNLMRAGGVPRLAGGFVFPESGEVAHLRRQRARGGETGGWVLTQSGPGLAVQLGRFLRAGPTDR